MWIEKLTAGVLRVTTPVGPRYIRPQFLQRLYLLWIFRHFQLLPLQVLSRQQQRLIDALCAEHRYAPAPYAEWEDAPILGTIEWRPRLQDPGAPSERATGGIRAAVARLAGATQHRS